MSESGNLKIILLFYQMIGEQKMRSSKCNNLNAKIAGPMELKHFNDAWANQNDNETNDSQMMNFLTDLSFNFTSKKWENQIVKYNHKDLKFISSVVTAGIERNSDLECRYNLNDIIGFRNGHG